MRKSFLKVFNLNLLLIVIVVMVFSLGTHASAEDLPVPGSGDVEVLGQGDDSALMLEADSPLTDDSLVDDEPVFTDEVAPLNTPPYATHLQNPERTAVFDKGQKAESLLSMTKSWSKGLRSFIDLFRWRSDGVLSRPVIYEGKLFTGSAKKRLYGFDIKNGKTLWSFKAGSDIVASPSVTAEMICFGTKGGVFHCLKTDTGEEIWSAEVEGEILSSPIFTSEAVYFTSTDNRIHAFNKESGERLWIYTHSSVSYVYPRLISSPAYSAERLFVLFGDGVMVSLKAKSGRLEWKERILKDPVASKSFRKTPLIDADGGGHLYVIDDDGRVVALNMSDGRVEYRYATKYVSDFTITDDILYTLTTEGHVEAIDIGTRTVLWGAQLNDGREGRSIAVMGGYVVLTSNGDHEPLGISILKKRVGHIDILSRSAGKGLWEKRLKSQVRSEPYLYDGHLAIVTIKGRLSVFSSKGEGSE